MDVRRQMASRKRCKLMKTKTTFNFILHKMNSWMVKMLLKKNLWKQIKQLTPIKNLISSKTSSKSLMMTTMSRCKLKMIKMLKLMLNKMNF